MPLPIIKGSNVPQYQKWHQRFSRWGQCETEQIFKGTDIIKMSVLAQTYYDNGYHGELDYERNVATLTITAPNLDLIGGGGSGIGSIIDKWEVAVDQEKPLLFENQNFLNLFTTIDATYAVPISQQVFAVIRQTASSAAPTWSSLVANLEDTPAVDANAAPLVPAKFLGGIISANLLYQAIKYFADDILRGQDSFIRGKYTLKHTTFAPNNYSANVADFNVQKIYSIPGLLSEAQNGGLWILTLPSFLAYKILAYPVPVAVPPNYMYGALKMRAPAVLAARGRIEITTEYLIDAWAKHTYGLAT